MSKSNKYITYFQAVTTVGIVSEAKNEVEAENKSKSDFDASNLAGGIVSQTPFEISETEMLTEGIGNVYMSVDEGDDNFNFEITDVMKTKIAFLLGKKEEDVTSDDYALFINIAIDRSLT